ncbi:hypothetical protein A3A14_01140 [Candidatus Daviesbacteria bacterium RIFCSPLOWO2_01_FULL_43_38]|uniref:Uncharacterized protein n=1 Tax=Candidatus Daviesbacteria bacterium RIFCSPHIGHO2_12_FULL_43_11 TaxID=1797780 RepID=A0A1F5K337_9BACT|nr:MAG: hypothetical protein A2874_01165 [Candidatus Daviesbacteria bacterium RIFCSPHIGHO2_01_FULL_43_17]OGE35198.1 MAG: hypothetical protein A3E45_02855 [Candidatus Daviesbacteria bacterium RIFCSPHIGHO2_12_FULL_43_11]OGE63381.1 MAG: hypothetical protein A3A14_01140 [Candidatus Daviesbacteria bacterium RIFCSPLOWO2_01_FULL_43_38]OGE70840.1 MAG: hypothetical protein A3J21_00490 [Candidatus Daviesbacteria bacterium RIFCSPLOWO2_02_FULL_43_11]
MQKGFVQFIVMGIVVLVLVGVGAFYLGKKAAVLKPQNQVVTSQVTPSSTPDETANWKTYTDQKLKVSIKYPDSIIILKSLPGRSVEFAKQKDYAKDFRLINTLAIYLRGEVGFDPEEVFRNGECGRPCDEKIQSVQINNAMGIKTLGPNYPSTDNYYLIKEDKTSPVIRLSVFEFGNPADLDKDLEPFKKMVQTFKFLE